MRLVSFSYEELTQHGVNPKFAQILSEPTSYHRDLDIHIGKTNWDYHVPEGVTEIVPLWDSNSDSHVRWNRHGQIEYVWLFHDDPKWILEAVSEQGIMARLWSEWCEHQETDAECRRFAEAIGFLYCEEAIRIWKKDYDRFQSWMRTLR